jgi:hypothetical protein
MDTAGEPARTAVRHSARTAGLGYEDQKKRLNLLSRTDGSALNAGSDHIVPQLIVLLRATSQNRLDLELSDFTEAQICDAVSRGFGPILRRATKANPRAVDSPLWLLLRAADLAAKVIAAEQIDAMVEIVDGYKSPLTLLKGISISHQHYPEPNLRPMRDIDIMVDEGGVGEIESLLVKLGYRQGANTRSKFYETHHHSQPFFHSKRGIWLEVHRRLFPKHSRLGRDGIFSPENVKAQLRISEFQRRRVNRLSNELQIVYIASHWASDFNVVGGMVAFLDIIFLLRNCGQQIDWSQILRWVDGSIACTHLYLLLSYIVKYRIIDISPEVLDELRARQRILTRLNLRIMHSVIDRYLVAGKSFGPILSERNISIAWATLLSWRAESSNLFLIPLSLILPTCLRARFQH